MGEKRFSSPVSFGKDGLKFDKRYTLENRIWGTIGISLFFICIIVGIGMLLNDLDINIKFINDIKNLINNFVRALIWSAMLVVITIAIIIFMLYPFKKIFTTKKRKVAFICSIVIIVITCFVLSNGINRYKELIMMAEKSTGVLKYEYYMDAAKASPFKKLTDRQKSDMYYYAKNEAYDGDTREAKTILKFLGNYKDSKDVLKNINSYTKEGMYAELERIQEEKRIEEELIAEEQKIKESKAKENWEKEKIEQYNSNHKYDFNPYAVSEICKFENIKSIEFCSDGNIHSGVSCELDKSMEKFTGKSDFIAYCENEQKLYICVPENEKIYLGDFILNYFYNCENIDGLENTISGKSISFARCEQLKSVDLTGMETHELEDIDFSNCTNIEKININNIDSTSLKTISFSWCKNLKELNWEEGEPINLTSMYKIFENCEKISSINLKRIKTKNIISMESAFAGCSKLAELDVSGFDTSNVKTMKAMFLGCNRLKSIDISNFNTNSLEDTSSMFDCDNLIEINLGDFNIQHCKNISRMFWCSNLQTIYSNVDFKVGKLEKNDNDSRLIFSPNSLKGGNGTTKYDKSGFEKKDAGDVKYAVVDRNGHQGYFTKKE